MPEKDNNILKYNHGEKSIKVPFAIILRVAVHYLCTHCSFDINRN